MIASFARRIYEGFITLRQVNHDQTNLVNNLKKLINKTKPSNKLLFLQRSIDRHCHHCRGDLTVDRLKFSR